MQTFWLVLLGFFVTGYLVLEGLDFGAGMLLVVFGRHDPFGARRDEVVRAFAPLFLGSEVWLVAAGGTLIGAFPKLDSALLESLYPVFVAILLGWMLRDAGLWLRGRGGLRWRAGWDWVIAGTSALLAFGWGVVLGDFADGLVPHASLFGPVPLLAGVLMVLLCALHGAVFLGVRLPSPPARRALGLARVLTLPAGAILAWLAVAATIGIDVPDSGAEFLLTVLLAAELVLTAVLAGTGRAARVLLAITSIGTAAIAPLVLVGRFPALPTGLSVATATVGAPTMGVLTAFVIPVLPFLVGYQAWLWWLSRDTASRRTWSFFA